MSSLQEQIADIINDEIELAKDAAKESAREAAEFSADWLKANSPKRAKRGGKYARAWAVKRAQNGLLTSYVVYNSRYPGLTMNLEFGHEVSNQYGSTGRRTEAIPHIAKAEELGIREFEDGIMKRMNRG